MKRTQEEKTLWKSRMTDLASTVRQMSSAEREELALRIGIVTCEGRTLSAYNQCFLAAQANGAPYPSMVGGCRQWGVVGRRVTQGNHAVGYIYVPIGEKSESEDPEEIATKPVRFRLVPVFDVSQTEEREATEERDES